MIDVMNPITEAWFNLLDGNLTYNLKEVKVYPEDADNLDDYHYVLIRAESETDSSLRSASIVNPIVAIEIVTFHDVSIRKQVCHSIYSQIISLVFPSSQAALIINGFQVSLVEPRSSTFLKEDDGAKRVYRKITRFFHRITKA